MYGYGIGWNYHNEAEEKKSRDKIDEILKLIRSQNENTDNDDWITVHGNHIKVRKGESKERAAKKFVEKHKKRDSIKLSKSEYGTVYHALNNNLTKQELIKKDIVTKYIGNYEYKIKINDFNDYDILKRRNIK